VNTTELIPSSLILAGVLVLYYGSVAANGFRLTVRMGYAYMAGPHYSNAHPPFSLSQF